MKVMIVESNPDRSESWVYSALGKHGISAEVVCDPNTRWLQTLRAGDVSVAPLRFRSRLDPAAILRLRRMVRNGSFDLVYAMDKRASTNLLAALAWIDMPVVLYRGIIGNLSRWNPQVTLTYFNGKVKRIICVCEAVRQYLLSIGISEGIPVTVHKGHDADWYKPSPRNVLNEFGIPANAFVVGCAARLRRRKGIGTLISAVSSVPDIHLLLVGEIVDSSIPALIAEKRLGDRVHVAGFRRDAAALMGACDCFAMPSLRREGLPRAVLEAMFQGVPPVVTDVGGMPEIVENGVSGLIVPPANPGAMAAALQRLASDPEFKTKLGNGAKARAVSGFDVRKTAAAYADVFFLAAGMTGNRIPPA